jgi:hypothetical protein
MKTLKKHTEEYIHIRKPNKRVLLGVLGTIIFSFLSYIFIKVLIELIIEKQIFKPIEEIPYNYVFTDLSMIPLTIFCYVLISLTIISFMSIFKKLKGYDESGLISYLIYGLIFGLTFSLIFALIYALIYGLISYLIYGLIFALIYGLTFVLIYGLIYWIEEKESLEEEK